MLEYRRVGELRGADAGKDLILPDARPLSYLRARTAASKTMGLTRALLEHRATEFRVRIPLVANPAADGERILAALERFGVSTVFPALDGDYADDGARVKVYWLDWVQLASVGKSLRCGFEEQARPVKIGGVELSPTFVLTDTPNAPRRDWQYWNSRWEFSEPMPEREALWRVRPNEARNRRAARWPRNETGLGAQARGSFAACLHPKMLEKLGKPRYVVIKHPFREGWLPVLALKGDFKDDGGKEAGEEVWGSTIFLDRTARDALGIADGELCHVYPWLHPWLSVHWRSMRDRVVGARTIAALARASARADLEKPVCRLEPEALEAIGARAGEVVVLEHICPPKGEAASDRWRRVHLSQRVLPISPAERAERKRWAATQAWDEHSAPRAEGRETTALEGYVDCGERLGVHPPYPAIYLNYYTRKHGLNGLGLCHPVQVRVGVPGRLMAEASEFAWLAVIALLGAAVAFVDSTALQLAAAAVLVLATVCLLVFRAVRAIR